MRRRGTYARRWALGLAAGLLLLVLHTRGAEAQSVRDKVKDHVDKELDGKKKPKGSSSSNGTRTRSRTRNGNSSGNSADGPRYTLGFADDPELTRPGPKLPRRYLPDRFRLNLKVGAAYQGWAPQQYDSAQVDIASYATWRISAKGKFFKRLTLHRGYFESNGINAPRNQGATIAAKVGKHVPKAGKALAYLGFPFLKTWQPIIRYEARAFDTVATPRIPVCIVDRNRSTDEMDCPRSDQELIMTSAYETFVVGIRYNSMAESRTMLATSKGKQPPVYAGIGLMSYNKPYQVNVDGVTLEEFLFDGRFRGAGLAFGGKFGGGPRRFFGRIDMQVGLGEVLLGSDLALTEVTPEDWLIGYVQGNLKAGYKFVLFEGPPTVYVVPSVTAGGASFHFVPIQLDEGETANAPSLNWDLLWSTRLSLEVAL